jgi:hypothetical protein
MSNYEFCICTKVTMQNPKTKQLPTGLSLKAAVGAGLNFHSEKKD